MTTYGYDADRRLTSVTEPISSGVNRTTTYDYYENGTLKDIIDANGNVTHWEMTSKAAPPRRPMPMVRPMRSETLRYEKTTSRLKSLTDALGNQELQLRTRRPLTGITYQNAANPTPNVTFGWDPYFPRLTSMLDGTDHKLYYTADWLEWSVAIGIQQGPFGNDTISHTYDGSGV